MSDNSTKKLIDHDVEMFKKYRNLLVELTRKNVKLKYRNSWLGIFWSFLQPLLNMAVLAIVFGSFFGGDRRNIVCYPIYLFTGRLVYEFFTASTKQAMVSFRKNAAIIKKVYVPKYMYPLSSILSTFVNFAISMICFICVWVFFKLTGFSHGDQLHLSWYALLFFVPMLIALVFSTGVGLILSVLEVFFKDIEYIWEVFMRLALYVVPILYTMEMLKDRPLLSAVIKINPLYSLIELFRDVMLYNQFFNLKHLLYATVVSLATFVVGAIIFNWKSDEIVYHL